MTNEQFEILLSEINCIKTQLYKIEEEIKIIKGETSVMTDHITFVEGVYNVVKHPFNSLMKRVYNKSYPMLE